MGKQVARRPPFIAAPQQAAQFIGGRMSHLERKLSILIVEEQDVMRRMLMEFVQSAYPGMTVSAAAYGERALELCRDNHPQLVLMNVTLPDANGIELTAQIREMLPETEVIIVSQHAVAAYVERAHAAGAFAYITKDKIYRNLLPTVGRALGRGPSGGGHGDPQ